MEKTLNNKQLACIGALMSKLGISGQQCKEMVSGFTSNRTDSRAKLYNSEANALIRHLKELDPQEKINEKMRKKILSMAHEMSWHKPGTKVLDMQRVDGWCCKFGLYKKKLNQHLYDELVQLVTQFERVRASFMASI